MRASFGEPWSGFALRMPPTTSIQIGKVPRRGYSNDPRHGSPCACADGGFCRGIDAGHVPWRRQQSVAEQGNKGGAARAALAVPTKEDAKTFTDPCAHFGPKLHEGDRQAPGASIYPAVQNIILACRAFGLGTLITTNHIRCEDEVRAVLDLPDDVSTYALMPIGYPQGSFGPLARRPVAEVTHADRWGVAWRC